VSNDPPLPPQEEIAGEANVSEECQTEDVDFVSGSPAVREMAEQVLPQHEESTGNTAAARDEQPSGNEEALITANKVLLARFDVLPSDDSVQTFSIPPPMMFPFHSYTLDVESLPEGGQSLRVASAPMRLPRRSAPSTPHLDGEKRRSRMEEGIHAADSVLSSQLRLANQQRVMQEKQVLFKEWERHPDPLESPLPGNLPAWESASPSWTLAEQRSHFRQLQEERLILSGHDSHIQSERLEALALHSLTSASPSNHLQHLQHHAADGTVLPQQPVTPVTPVRRGEGSERVRFSSSTPSRPWLSRALSKRISTANMLEVIQSADKKQKERISESAKGVESMAGEEGITSPIHLKHAGFKASTRVSQSRPRQDRAKIRLQLAAKLAEELDWDTYENTLSSDDSLQKVVEEAQQTTDNGLPLVHGWSEAQQPRHAMNAGANSDVDSESSKESAAPKSLTLQQRHRIFSARSAVSPQGEKEAQEEEELPPHARYEHRRAPLLSLHSQDEVRMNDSFQGSEQEVVVPPSELLTARAESHAQARRAYSRGREGIQGVTSNASDHSRSSSVASSRSKEDERTWDTDIIIPEPALKDDSKDPQLLYSLNEIETPPVSQGKKSALKRSVSFGDHDLEIPVMSTPTMTAQAPASTVRRGRARAVAAER
jgi:hypothetical protein